MLGTTVKKFLTAAKKKWPYAILLIVVFAIAIYAVCTSSAYKSCKAEQSQHAAQQQQQKGPFSFPRRIIHQIDTVVRCTVESVDAIEGILTLLATIAIAAFTGTLWRSTDKMMLAGENQIKISRQLAKAATAANERTREIERAYLTGGGSRLIIKGTGEEAFALMVGNDGKTPAFLLRYAIKICERTELLEGPRYEEKPHSDRIAPTANKTIKIIQLPKALTDPVVYGRFWYHDIWREEEHSFGFLLSIPHKEGGGIPDIVKVGDAPISEAFTTWT